MLRNLAAHGGGDEEISVNRARQYVALADTISYILQKTPAAPEQPPAPAV